MPGTSLGMAQGSITIETTGLKEAGLVARAVGQQIGQSFKEVDLAAKQVEQSVAKAASGIKSLQASSAQNMGLSKMGAHGLQIPDMDAITAFRKAEADAVKSEAAAIKEAADGIKRADAAARKAASDAAKNLARVEVAAKKAAAGVESLSSSMGRLGNAIGVATGIAAVVGLGRFALDADALATSYKRQEIAALNLAGSQGKLNELLVAYEKATGGAVDKATSLSNVTKLQALGFANSAKELERFTIVARGIALATGQTQESVIGELQMAISNQSLLRLNKLGLGVDEVKTRIDALMAADKNLSKEMAYQNAILGIADQK